MTYFLTSASICQIWNHNFPLKILSVKDSYCPPSHTSLLLLGCRRTNITIGRKIWFDLFFSSCRSFPVRLKIRSNSSPPFILVLTLMSFPRLAAKKGLNNCWPVPLLDPPEGAQDPSVSLPLFTIRRSKGPLLSLVLTLMARAGLSPTKKCLFWSVPLCDPPEIASFPLLTIRSIWWGLIAVRAPWSSIFLKTWEMMSWRDPSLMNFENPSVPHSPSGSLEVCSSKSNPDKTWLQQPTCPPATTRCWLRGGTRRRVHPSSIANANVV